MIETTAKRSRGTIWAMSLAAGLCCGCALAQQQGQQFQEEIIDKGLVRTLDLNGKKLWDFESKGEVECVVAGPGNFVYVTAKAVRVQKKGVNGDLVTVLNSKVYALDKKTGKRIWEFTVPGHRLTPLLVAGDRIVVGTLNDLQRDVARKEGYAIYILDGKEGKLISEIPIRDPIPFELFLADGLIFAITKRAEIHPFRDYNDHLLVVDPNTGKLMQKFSASGLADSPEATLEGFLFGKEIVMAVQPIESMKKSLLVCLDAMTGKTKWKVAYTRICHIHPVVLHAGTCLVITEDVGEGDVFLSAHSMATGEQLWKSSFALPRWPLIWPLETKNGPQLGIIEEIFEDMNLFGKNGFDHHLQIIEPKSGAGFATVRLPSVRGRVSLQGQAVMMGKPFLNLTGIEGQFLTSSTFIDESTAFVVDNRLMIAYGRPNAEGMVLQCVDALTGMQIWKRETDKISLYNPDKNLCFSNGMFYLRFENTLECWDFKTGKSLWSVPQTNLFIKEVKDDMIFLGSSRGYLRAK